MASGVYMIFISHRGNIYGPDPKENFPEHVLSAISSGYNCEIDVWVRENRYYLGHDKPCYEISDSFLRHPKLWCHAKNMGALHSLRDLGVHFFWHENDEYAITSRGYIISHPQSCIMAGSIAMLPKIENENVGKSVGVCSDSIAEFRRTLQCF